MSGAYYLGEYTSAIARAKKILIANGFEWSRTTGRYPNHKTTPGVRVTRVGCSDTITLHGYTAGGYAHDSAKRRELERRALECLRANGLPFRENGFLDCGPRARKAFEAERRATNPDVRFIEASIAEANRIRENDAPVTVSKAEPQRTFKIPPRPLDPTPVAGCICVDPPQACDLHAAAPEMVNALRAVLLFHGGGDWNRERAAEWERLTGSSEATTRAMCDAVRAALSKAGVA